MYDKRKNKVVTYNSDGFSCAQPKELVDEHTRTKNRKFESYTCKNYDYFVVNQEIGENENGPGLIFKVENIPREAKKLDTQLKTDISKCLTDKTKVHETY